MLFYDLSQYFQKLENTSSRNEMTEILAELFAKSSNEEIGKICYLLQGRVAPLYEAIEFGLADKTMMKALSIAYNISLSEITQLFKKEGDLGIAAEILATKVKSLAEPDLAPRGKKYKVKGKNVEYASEEKLSIIAVYNRLYELATTIGSGSVDKKIYILSELLRNLDSLSVRFVVRIPLAKLRLGFSDMTILDALSYFLFQSKKERKQIEACYNVRPDLGFIAEQIKEKGIKGVQKVTPVVGTPVLMTRAERLGNTQEIIDKIGKCAVEYKYDGFRLQVHYTKVKGSPFARLSRASGDKQNSKLFEDEEPIDHVRLFSRNLEDVTSMYPDIIKGVCEQIKVGEAIFEGEALAFNPKTKEFLPFQETVQRKRKYDITQKAIDIPLKLIIFELLYVDGESLLEKPYTERRKRLEKII